MPDIRSYHYKSWSDVYEENLSKGVRAAYEIAEEKFKEKIGTPYYSSFESFKSARTIRRKTIAKGKARRAA